MQIRFAAIALSSRPHKLIRKKEEEIQKKVKLKVKLKKIKKLEIFLSILAHLHYLIVK